MYLKTLCLVCALIGHVLVWSQETPPFSWISLADHHQTHFGYLDCSMGEFMTSIKEASIILEQGFLHHEYLDHTTTSIQSVEASPRIIQAWPNPANNRLVIQHDLRGPTELRVWDLYGQLIFKAVLYHQHHSLTTSHFPAQTYFIALYQNGRLQDQKAISIIH